MTDKPHMTYAVIDIGTNTFRLLIAEVSPGHDSSDFTFKEIHSERTVARLGEGLSESGVLSSSAMERGINALIHFRSLIDKHKASDLLAVATSALRNARNSTEFISRAKEAADIEIHVITGEKEAELTAAGIFTDIDTPQSSLMIDIGGGSTELIFMSEKQPLKVQTLDLGVVYLAEEHMKSDPPSQEDLNMLEKEISERLRPALTGFPQISAEGTLMIGTAGTITALAAAMQKLDKYDHSKVHKYRMKRTDIEDIYSLMTSMTTSERSELLPFEPSRLDIIVPGTLILLKLMSDYGFDEIIVSNYGLREGILKELYTHRSGN